MQSGISVSQELHSAFQDLVSDSSKRALIAGIQNESIVPLQTCQSHSPDFSSDLDPLQSHLTTANAAYVILRRYPEADGFVAVTYVPNAAPVRQKMLFASTRLTLARELGIERFRETVLVTTKEELTSAGWAKHDAHGASEAPLTEEEKSLAGIRQAEAEESRGTGARRAHVGAGSSGIGLPIAEEAVEALRALRGGADNLVQLEIDISSETISLASSSSVAASSLSGCISTSSPRYSFFRYDHTHEGVDAAPIVFIYTCPAASKVKERMVYASSRASVVRMAKTEAGLEIERTMEATSPGEITEEALREELHPRVEEKRGFERPKRPGRRG